MALVLAPTRHTGTGRVLVALVGLFALYVMGVDQGRLLSVVQGQTAIDQNLIHEFVHDARHTAGFPCH
jgi:putative cobalt transporter subunit CbtB